MSDFTSRDFSSPEAYEFVKALQATCPSGSRRFSQIFDDFCSCAALTIRQGVVTLLTGKQDPEIETRYLEHVSHYKREHVVNFAKAFAMLADGLEACVDMRSRGVEYKGNKPLSGDFLGGVYEAAGCSNSQTGQFFTPWCLSSMMARMNFMDAAPDSKNRVTLMEPCIGSGGMVLAVAEVLREKEFGPRDWWFVAQDIDQRCFNMAYVQLSLMGCPGVVRLGNTLSNEPPRLAWLTPTGALFPYRPKTEQVDVANLPQPPAAPDAPAAVQEDAPLILESPASAPDAPDPGKEPPNTRKRASGAHKAPAGDVSASQDQLSLF